MKFYKILSWLTGATFLVVVANHFFNPNFTLNMTLMFALSFALFTFSAIDAYKDQHKKIAALYFFTGAVCFLGLIVELVGVNQS